MKISCIIPVINESERIIRSIEGALRAGCDEVIVADGGSTDGTLDLVATAPCQLVQCSPGRALQQNEGVCGSSGDVLYFQHADNRLAEGAADQIRAVFSANPAAVCGAFWQRIESPEGKYRLLEWGNAARVRLLGAPYGDQGIFVRRETFEQLGGFPRVPILEELALMRKLRRVAWPYLLAGPLYVDARRWKERGVVRQTLRNWRILALHAAGRSPEELQKLYPRHDESSARN